MSLLPGHKEPKLEKVSIAGTMFLVDPQKRELRQESNEKNRISFDRLATHQSKEGINIVFDKITKNLYTGFLTGEGLPPMTERAFLNSALIEHRDNTRQWQGEWNKTSEQLKTVEQKKDQKQKIGKRRSISRRI